MLFINLWPHHRNRRGGFDAAETCKFVLALSGPKLRAISFQQPEGGSNRVISSFCAYEVPSDPRNPEREHLNFCAPLIPCEASPHQIPPRQ
jgi:hypothetical protein